MIFKNKWKEKHKSFIKSLKDAFALQLKEDGGERTKIINEILESLTIGHPLHWFKCVICKRWRPFEKIDVLTKPIIDERRQTTFGEYNINYCNDIEDCKKGAENMDDIKVS